MTGLKGEGPDAAVTAIEPQDHEHVGTLLNPSSYTQPDHSSTPAPLTTAGITAAQIETDCPAQLQELGKRIAAYYGKLLKCEDKAEQYKISIDQLLAQAKKVCDEGGFTVFRERFCPNLGRTRAYQLLQIASGKKSVEDARAENAERNRQYRAKKKKAAAEAKAKAEAEAVHHVTDEAVAEDDAGASAKERGQYYAETEDGAEATGEAPAAVAEATTPPATDTIGAAPDVEAEIEALKKQKAKLKSGKVEDKFDEQASTKALAKFKTSCGILLKMNIADLQDAIDHFAEVAQVPAGELVPDLGMVQLDLKIAKVEITALKRELADKLPPRESRAARWLRLAGDAVGSTEELIALQQEFAEAKDGQPDSLQNGPFAQKCDEICGIDLESALETLQEAESAEVPLGFGRD